MRKIFLFLLFFVGTFLCIGIEKTLAATEINADISSSTIWDKEGSPYIVKKSINVSAPLTIKPGVIVKFEYGQTARLIIKNEFIAIGTPEERIYFTSIRDDEVGGDYNNDGQTTNPSRNDWSGLTIANNIFDASLEYVSIYYSWPALAVSNNSQNTTKIIVKNSEIKNNYEGVRINGADPIIKGNVITQNRVGIIISSNKSNIIPTFRNNSITGNGIGIDGRAPYGTIPINIDAKYNWWGDESGPYYDYDNGIEEKNISGNGNRILGYGTMFRPWLNEDNHLAMKGNPVILIPGIGASVNWDVMVGGIFSDKWTIYSHTYDGIIQALKKMGYEEGKDLFVCYYDWRMSNADSANEYLKPLIEKAKINSGLPRVDIIAHSMGGIVARSYVQSDEYANDVDNLILIATPNKGSSDIYPVWEGGYIPKTWDKRILINSYLRYMNVKGRTFNNYETIHQYIPSIKELMPIYDYVYSKNDNSDVIDYSTMMEVNNFLINLGNNAEKLNNRVRLSIIAGNNQETANTIPVVSVPEENPLWIDGKPDPLDLEKDSTNGDGRVMYNSSIIYGLFQNTLDYDHSDIVSQSEKIIASRILEDLDVIYPAPDVNSEIGFWVASPLDIKIKDPNEKIISKDTSNIPLAQYSGESNPDGFKFVSIPNPVEGEYKIELTGNGNGEYHLGLEYADYSGEKENKSAVIGGETKEGDVIEYKIEYNPQNLEEPVSEIKSNDTTPPTITGSVIAQPNANGWYNSDVTIHFEATDNESGLDFVTQDVIITTEGKNQSATGIAKDKAGNEASFTISGINIDKTAPSIEISSPEAKIYLNNQIVGVDYTVLDNLSQNIQTEIALDGNVFVENNIDLSLQKLGEHKFKITAINEAGNQSEKEISFTIETGVKAIIDNVNHYATLNLIKNKTDKTVLISRLKLIQEIEKLIKMIEDSKFFKGKVREKLIKALEEQINWHLDWLAQYVNQRSKVGAKSGIDPKIGSLLIESLLSQKL